MKNKQNISPVGLKGNQILERQLSLMGIKPINENEKKSNSAVELTKIGPDGNAYAIVRENHEYYIKRSNKTTGLVLEDFKYIGGLQNKKEESHPTYARAIKQLNFKFKSLAEAFNKGGDINVFEDDNLLTESGIAGFSQMEGSGFSGAGNLDDNEEMYKEEVYEEEEPLNEFEQAIEEMMAREENLNLGDDIMNNNAEIGPFGDEGDDYTDYTMGNHDDSNQMPNPPRQLNIPEEMSAKNKDLAAKRKPFNKITQADVLDARGVDLDEELHGGQHKLDVAKPKGKLTKADFDALNSMEESIKRLDALLEGELKKKVVTKK
jgi:hypothetical protein